MVKLPSMIVSASYRTDIPAFYGEWFLNRFRAGFAKVANPYSRQVGRVDLRSDVDGFIFWTRNAAPFTQALAEIRAAALPFVIQYTITGYPRALESSVIKPEQAVAQIHKLADLYGSRAVVWRYDPIVFSDVTPAAFHLHTFTRLAQALSGAVDEVVISFANIYRKTARNLNAAAQAEGFSWQDPPAEAKLHLAAALATVAAEQNLTLSICSQEHYIVPGTKAAACIDARRLEDVARHWGIPSAIRAKVKGNRPGCCCHESRDIGEYDTCPHGCTYCYAVNSRDLAKHRFHEHDPHSEFLFSPKAAP